MIHTLMKFKWELGGALLGAAAGYFYYYFVGCASGTCAITADPLNSTLYGALMGALLASTVRPSGSGEG